MTNTELGSRFRALTNAVVQEVEEWRSCLRTVFTRSLAFFFFSSRRRHTRLQGDWSSDVCSSDLPPWFGPSGWPSRARTSGTTPGSGSVAEPGLVGMAPGSGEIMMPPVSVCHQVSTIGQRSPPITRWYHIHASGLMGSPTVPRRRSEERSCLRGHSLPHLTKARIAVGAV